MQIETGGLLYLQLLFLMYDNLGEGDVDVILIKQKFQLSGQCSSAGEYIFLCYIYGKSQDHGRISQLLYTQLFGNL